MLPVRPRTLRSQVFPFTLKQVPCPHCQSTGNLNRHSISSGNDPHASSGDPQPRHRGQRAYCSNRGQRSGCGRTFSILLAFILPRHTVSAHELHSLLNSPEGTLPERASLLKLPFGLETLRSLLRRLRQRLDRLRTQLSSRIKPPASTHSDPLNQTFDHLRSVFSSSTNLVSDFQLSFQAPFLA